MAPALLPGRQPATVRAATVRLTQASAPLMQKHRGAREIGAEREVAIPAERALTVFVDKRSSSR